MFVALNGRVVDVRMHACMRTRTRFFGLHAHAVAYTGGKADLQHITSRAPTLAPTRTLTPALALTPTLSSDPDPSLYLSPSL